MVNEEILETKRSSIMKYKNIIFFYILLLIQFVLVGCLGNSSGESSGKNPAVKVNVETELMAVIFNSRASSPKNMPDLVLETLDIKPGNNIVDLGAGGGYFTKRFAKETGKNGKVFAVDIDPDLLEYVKQNAEKAGLTNINYIFAQEDDPFLPDKIIDLIFVRNVFHFIDEPVTYFRRLKSALKPDGRIAIIEHSDESQSIGTKDHFTPKKELIKKMELAGYRVLDEFEFLPELSFVIFKMNSEEI